MFKDNTVLATGNVILGWVDDITPDNRVIPQWSTTAIMSPVGQVHPTHKNATAQEE